MLASYVSDQAEQEADLASQRRAHAAAANSCESPVGLYAASLVAPVWPAALRRASPARRFWWSTRYGGPSAATRGSARWWRWPGVGVETRRVRVSRAPPEPDAPAETTTRGRPGRARTARVVTAVAVAAAGRKEPTANMVL